jgi:hypothetical protein
LTAPSFVKISSRCSQIIIEWQWNERLYSVLAYIGQMLIFNPVHINGSSISSQIARRKKLWLIDYELQKENL